MQVVVTKPMSGPLGMKFLDIGLDGTVYPNIRKIVFQEVGAAGASAGICQMDQLVGINERGFSAESSVDRVVGLIGSLPAGPFTLFIKPGPNRQSIATGQSVIAPVSAVPASVASPMPMAVATASPMPTAQAQPVAARRA